MAGVVRTRVLLSREDGHERRYQHGRSVMLGRGGDAAKSLQPCPSLCDPIDGSPTGSPIPGILQARTLECQFSHSVVSDSL